MEMEKRIHGTRIRLLLGDITEQTVDCIVNAANPTLLGGGGVDGAIHGAGGPEILEACRAIRAERGNLPTGQAVSTTAGMLNAARVIHTVGPVWSGGEEGEAELLGDCYRNALALVVAEGFSSVAFPAISTGIYGYPPHLAAPVALNTVKDFIKSRFEVDPSPVLEEVRHVLFFEEDFAIYEDVLSALPDG